MENRTEGRISSIPLFLSVRGRNERGSNGWHGSRNEIPFVARKPRTVRDAILEDERGCTLQGRREEGEEGEGEIESVR